MLGLRGVRMKVVAWGRGKVASCAVISCSVVKSAVRKVRRKCQTAVYVRVWRRHRQLDGHYCKRPTYLNPTIRDSASNAVLHWQFWALLLLKLIWLYQALIWHEDDEFRLQVSFEYTVGIKRYPQKNLILE